MKDKETPRKVYWVEKRVTIKVPMCPKCNKQISEVTDPDFRTMATFHCNHCGYSQ